MKIAIFLPNWIGDAVMATPAIRAVRLEYPSAEVIAVVRPYVADVLAGLDLIDRLLLHDPRGSDRERRGWRFVRRLRSERFDVALLFPNSLRCGWNAWLSGARRRIGFARSGRGWMLTDPLQRRSKKKPHPVIDEYLRLAEHLGCRQLSPRMELATQPDDERQLEEFWSGHDSQLQQAGFVCLNPGGAFGAAKHWPAASFGACAEGADPVDEFIKDTIHDSLPDVRSGRVSNVVVVSHDHGYAPVLREVLAAGGSVTVIGFREWLHPHLAGLEAKGAAILDLEYDLEAFDVRLPRPYRPTWRAALHPGVSDRN
ncbi:MAG: glycosyltransferase family 9 protein [Planctomycetes bacterium]|nr:glycosyltransferase family 9 protein [Planctomycetota bacterium]